MKKAYEDFMKQLDTQKKDVPLPHKNGNSLMLKDVFASDLVSFKAIKCVEKLTVND